MLRPGPGGGLLDALTAPTRPAVRPLPGRVRLSGSLLEAASEATLKSSAPRVLVLTLEDDYWHPSLGRLAASRRGRPAPRGLRIAQFEPAGAE